MARRVIGLVLVLVGISYLMWMIPVLNGKHWVLGGSFFIANAFLVVLVTVSVINNLSHVDAPVYVLDFNQEEAPWVAIIIPTLNEALDIVEATVRSVAAQDYDPHKMVIVISDDRGRPGDKRGFSLLFLAVTLDTELPCQVVYHAPTPHRDFKAGNLNSALQLVVTEFPQIEFIETRDCDDMVGDPNFLRAVMYQMLIKPRAAFVQTIKRYYTSPGDPGGNQEETFYYSNMAARHATNAVFPCGSGVVYRLAALEEIGGFITSGPVEDLRTGYALLKRQWRGVFLAIVGAISAYPPENVASIVKQRGTWAFDSQSLFIWSPPLFTRGLSWRQRFQFLELSLFYWFSAANLIFMITVMVALFTGIYPLVTDHMQYAVHFWPFMALVEIFLNRVNAKLSFESQWRSRQIWISMAPVFLLASVKAILNGPRRRPHYKVTVKGNHYQFYWRQSWPQWFLSIGLMVAVVYHMSTRSLFLTADLGSVFWATYFVVALLPMTQGSLRGVDIKEGFKVAIGYRQRATNWATVPRYALITLVLAVISTTAITFILTGVTNQGRAVGNSYSMYEGDAPTFTRQAEEQSFGLGVYNERSPYDDFASILEFQAALNHDLKYSLWFQAMGDGDKNFAADWVQRAAELGLTPMITLEPWQRDFNNRQTVQPQYSFASIIAGNHDQYFRQWADDARNAGVEMILRFAHEQATDLGVKAWYPWQGDPEGFVGAFRHIVGIFRQEGATNVRFIWSAMWLDQDNSWLYYPGDDWVDLIGTTVLNHGTVPADWGHWATFDDLFWLQYAEIVSRTNKPIMITEVASAEQGGDKGQWLADMLSELATKEQQVSAVFLLETTIDREYPAINWSVRSTPETFAQFTQAYETYFDSANVSDVG